MATATFKLTNYTTVKLTYNIENVSNTAMRLTVTGYAFTNTRSTGTVNKVRLGVFSDWTQATPADSYYPTDGSAMVTIAAGTKSKSGSITHWDQWTRTHSTQTKKAPLNVWMQDTSTHETWDKTVSVSVSVPAKPSYTVSFDANGGTGAPSSQPKWYGETLKLASAQPTWTEHTFKGWGTSKTTQNVSYAPGASYTANAALALYAVWTCAIEYNANGGDFPEGFQTSQTKYAYTNISLSTEKPTWDGYDFKGWATSASGPVAYQPGAPYTSSSGATLYAVWAVTPPSVSVKAERAAIDDTTDPLTYTPSLVGTYALVTVTYSLSSATQLDAVSCSVGGESATFVSSSGTTTVYASASPYGLTEQPTVEVSVSDAASNVTTKTLQLPTAAPPIHFKPGGGGVGIGVPSVKDGFAVSMDAFFRCWAGVVQMFAGEAPPNGWLLCDGAAVSRTEYAVLFDAIGTTWGAGDGSTTFNLPDLRGRSAVGELPYDASDTKNLLLTDTVVENREVYRAYALKHQGNVVVGRQYVLVLEDVSIRNNAATTSNIGLGVYLGGSSAVNELAIIQGSPDNDGIGSLKSFSRDGIAYAAAKRLVLHIDTTGKTKGDDNLWIYNSVGVTFSSGELSVGRWMMVEEGDYVEGMPWEPRFLFHRYGHDELGAYGGVEGNDLQVSKLPAHNHGSGTMNPLFWSSYSVSGIVSTTSGTANIANPGSGASLGSRALNIATTNVGNSHTVDLRSPFAVVKYIIHTGKMS